MPARTVCVRAGGAGPTAVPIGIAKVRKSKQVGVSVYLSLNSKTPGVLKGLFLGSLDTPSFGIWELLTMNIQRI